MALLNNTIVNGILRANVVAVNTIKDSTGSVGTSNQLLISTGSVVQWKTAASVIAVVNSTTAGLAPAATTNNGILMRLGNSASVSWNAITIVNGGTAATSTWGVLSSQ